MGLGCLKANWCIMIFIIMFKPFLLTIDQDVTCTRPLEECLAKLQSGRFLVTTKPQKHALRSVTWCSFNPKLYQCVTSL
jgi:hypothetical protein